MSSPYDYLQDPLQPIDTPFQPRQPLTGAPPYLSPIPQGGPAMAGMDASQGPPQLDQRKTALHALLAGIAASLLTKGGLGSLAAGATGFSQGAQNANAQRVNTWQLNEQQRLKAQAEQDRQAALQRQTRNDQFTQGIQTGHLKVAQDAADPNSPAAVSARETKAVDAARGVLTQPGWLKLPMDQKIGLYKAFRAGAGSRAADIDTVFGISPSAATDPNGPAFAAPGSWEPTAAAAKPVTPAGTHSAQLTRQGIIDSLANLPFAQKVAGVNDQVNTPAARAAGLGDIPTPGYAPGTTVPVLGPPTPAQFATGARTLPGAPITDPNDFRAGELRPVGPSGQPATPNQLPYSPTVYNTQNEITNRNKTQAREAATAANTIANTTADNKRADTALVNNTQHQKVMEGIAQQNADLHKRSVDISAANEALAETRLKNNADGITGKQYVSGQLGRLKKAQSDIEAANVAKQKAIDKGNSISEVTAQNARILRSQKIAESVDKDLARVIGHGYQTMPDYWYSNNAAEQAKQSGRAGPITAPAPVVTPPAVPHWQNQPRHPETQQFIKTPVAPAKPATRAAVPAGGRYGTGQVDTGGRIYGKTPAAALTPPAQPVKKVKGFSWTVVK